MTIDFIIGRTNLPANLIQLTLRFLQLTHEAFATKFCCLMTYNNTPHQTRHISWCFLTDPAGKHQIIILHPILKQRIEIEAF